MIWIGEPAKTSACIHPESRQMKFLMNIALGAALLINAICLNHFYGNGLVGFLVLMAFTFMGILILLAANHSD
jgi:hypothetical protein